MLLWGYINAANWDHHYTPEFPVWWVQPETACDNCRAEHPFSLHGKEAVARYPTHIRQCYLDGWRVLWTYDFTSGYNSYASDPRYEHRLRNTTTIQTPIGLELMLLSVPHINTRPYHWNHFGYGVCDRPTVDMRGCVPAVQEWTGWNYSWQVGGYNHRNTRHGGPGTEGRLVARSHNNIQDATIEEVSRYNIVEDSAVEQTIRKEEDGEVTGIWI